jgi:fatty-acyl-CoA synthase
MFFFLMLLFTIKEWDDIALNYTSGTTGNPKGVLLHHRGAYLNSIGNIMSWSLTTTNNCVLLWTLPMFHCNGWCFPWTIAAVAGTHVCLRNVNAKNIFDAIKLHKVSHFCGAPIIMQMIINATDEERQVFNHQVSMMTAAAPPPAPVLAAMKKQNIEITHVYGLSEVYGPAVVCSWHDEWNTLNASEQASKKSRQGVRYPVLEGLMVANPETMQPVPRDGKTIGEIFMQGNIVMKGYLKNKKATEEAFAGGWFHSGDLAVWHPDGYIQIADRSKDIIISGGENISSVEIQDVLYAHPDVADAAVVARPDKKWGETPCAFIELKPGSKTTEKELSEFCRARLAGFKRPKTFVFIDLPKTSTGKIQKFKLRDQAKMLNTKSNL